MLIVPLGMSPQILTETIWSLFVQEKPSYRPEKVIVLTTSAGEALIRGKLLGESVRLPHTGQLLDEGIPRWEIFCRDVLGGFQPELELHVVRDAEGHPLIDIRNASDDACFGDLCYNIVYQLTRSAQSLPVLGSMAGGRKTMSAHLMVAFSVFARPQDQLFHVLVWPSSLEQSDFFYPTGQEEVVIDRVEVRFPRLYRVLQEKLRPDHSGTLDLKSILNLLEPYAVADRRPTHARIYVGGRDSGGQIVEVYEGSELLDSLHVTPSELATLLCIAELILREGRAEVTRFSENLAVEKGGLLEKEVQRWRRDVVWMCAGNVSRLQDWESSEDVSKAVSKVHRRLRDHPVVLKYLGLQLQADASRKWYIWKHDPPPRLEIVITRNAERWPFQLLKVISS